MIKCNRKFLPIIKLSSIIVNICHPVHDKFLENCYQNLADDALPNLLPNYEPTNKLIFPAWLRFFFKSTLESCEVDRCGYTLCPKVIIYIIVQVYL